MLLKWKNKPAKYCLLEESLDVQVNESSQLTRALGLFPTRERVARCRVRGPGVLYKIWSYFWSHPEIGLQGDRDRAIKQGEYSLGS